MFFKTSLNKSTKACLPSREICRVCRVGSGELRFSIYICSAEEDFTSSKSIASRTHCPARTYRRLAHTHHRAWARANAKCPLIWSSMGLLVSSFTLAKGIPWLLSLHLGLLTSQLHLGSSLPRLHLGPSSLWLRQAPSSLRHHLGQLPLCLHHGLPGISSLHPFGSVRLRLPSGSALLCPTGCASVLKFGSVMFPFACVPFACLFPWFLISTHLFLFQLISSSSSLSFLTSMLSWFCLFYSSEFILCCCAPLVFMCLLLWNKTTAVLDPTSVSLPQPTMTRSHLPLFAEFSWSFQESVRSGTLLECLPSHQHIGSSLHTFQPFPHAKLYGI